MNMKNALLTVLVALSTSVFAQEAPTVFQGETFERLSDNLIVFTENDGRIYSKISECEVIIDTKTGGNPLVFKYSHYVGEKKKGA